MNERERPGNNDVLQGLIDSLQDPVFSLDSDYCYTSFNRAHAAVIKALYGQEIALGRSLLDCMTVAADRDQARKNIERALRGEAVVAEAFSGEEARSRVYFTVSHNPIRDQAGKIVGVAVIAQDITARRRAEEEASHLASFPMLNPQPVIEVDAAGKAAFLNPAARQLFPDLEKLGIGHPFLTSWAAVADACRSGADLPVREVVVGGRWYQQVLHCVPGARLVRVYGLDITGRKQAEAELREKMGEFKLLSEVAVGRELKLMEREQEVNKLLTELGRETKYK